jgi:uncharacterized protein YjfI (DUF2170 family)
MCFTIYGVQGTHMSQANEVQIATRKVSPFTQFLEMNEFVIEDLGNQVYRAERDGELPVFIKILDNQMFFEVDLGNVTALANERFYFELLDLNTEILPVSFGIDNTNTEDPRLVLVESRETDDLNDQELLAVFDALELAVDRAEILLNKYITK